MERCGLPSQCQRLSIQFMGCFGALSGLKTARAFAAERSSNVVLLVCCELCSLHMQLDARVDNMVGSALFADGASAVIVAQPSASSHAILRSAAASQGATVRAAPLHVSYRARHGGHDGVGADQHVACRSASAVRYPPPSTRPSRTSPLCYCSPHPHAKHIPYSDMRWCLHPGGPMIIQAICERLGLVEADVEEVWSVLRRYGNMSSATLLFVLDEMRKKVHDRHSRSALLCCRLHVAHERFLGVLCLCVSAIGWSVGTCARFRARAECGGRLCSVHAMDQSSHPILQPSQQRLRKTSQHSHRHTSLRARKRRRRRRSRQTHWSNECRSAASATTRDCCN